MSLLHLSVTTIILERKTLPQCDYLFQLLLALIIHTFCGIIHLTTPIIILMIVICFKIQGQKEIDELGLRLQEMYQLHENTLNELQSLKSENEDLLEEKVWFKFSSLIV